MDADILVLSWHSEVKFGYGGEIRAATEVELLLRWAAVDWSAQCKAAEAFAG
jgi:hypothetical protein